MPLKSYKICSEIFEHGFDPPPLLNNVKKTALFLKDGFPNRKKYFWRKLHLCTAGCRTCCHLSLFPFVVSGDIFVGVKYSEMFYLKKFPSLHCRLPKLLPSCTFFPHHCPQFKSLFNPVRSWWIFFSLLCSVLNSKSYSCAWNFFLAPCIHQCKRAYIQFWCDPVPGYDPDMTLFSMGVVV